ncbi:MAG: hypothetical protein AB1422_10605, partial [bacterium]
FPQSISTYFYKFQSISIILSPYHSYLLIPFLTLLIYSLNGYSLRLLFFPYLKNVVTVHRRDAEEQRRYGNKSDNRKDYWCSH